ncbi:MAG: SDR family oxidoreductase [Pseudomonadota bacterium]
MNLGLHGKIALVGGAGKGLGRAAAFSLAREGVKVGLISRTRATLEKTAAEIEAATGSEARAIPADLADRDQAVEAARAAVRLFGRVDILVNNAGGPPSGQFLDFADADWDRAFQLNLMSAISLARELVPGMKARGFGRIVNITSLAVKQPLDGLILSNAIRAGLHGWAKSLSNELAPFGITVNNILPGYTLTDRVGSLAAVLAQKQGTTPEAVIAGWEAGIPMKRLGRPEDLGDLAAFLASEQAGYITGTSILIDGGAYKGLM